MVFIQGCLAKQGGVQKYWPVHLTVILSGQAASMTYFLNLPMDITRSIDSHRPGF
jgi:hypothetical protein